MAAATRRSIKSSVGSWQAGAVNNPADVRTVQEMLSAVSRALNHAQNLNPGAIDGKIVKSPGQSLTVQAIIAFQKDVLGITTPDGRIDLRWGCVNPGKVTFNGLDYLEGSNLQKLFFPLGVNDKLRKGVIRLIAHVGHAVVNSGKRTVEEQAGAMLTMTSKNLDMYCPNGVIPDYVTKLRELMTNKKYTKENIISVLNEALKTGHRISHHLKGNAVDVSDSKGDFRHANALGLEAKCGVAIFACSEEKKLNCNHYQLIKT
jgi:hypothetical protein